MRTLRIAVAVALLLPACSCVPLPSFYPLWDEQHAAFEPRLLGEWRDVDPDEDGGITISESKEKTYLVTSRGKEKKTGKLEESRYEARLVRLGEHLFLDFIGDEEWVDKRLEGESYQSLVLMHFFARVKLEGETLRLALMDDEKFEKRVLKKDIDAPFLKRGDIILLTADTAKIQQVLSQFAQDKDLWDETSVLHRTK